MISLLERHIFSLSKVRLLQGTMPGQVFIDTLQKNADFAKQQIASLKNELKVLTEEINARRVQQLREENAQLTAAVEAAKQRLVQTEIANNVEQIPLPGSKVTCSSAAPVTEAQPSKPQEVAKEAKTPAVKKEKKPKEPKEPKEPVQEAPVDVSRLDLRIAKVEDVQRHPDADSLYLLKVNCGEDKPRTVCSGLVKFIELDALKDRMVVLLCNLKPVKMRGITSEAMVMCASTPEKVEVLAPPPGCNPGDLVHCDGFSRQPDPVMNPKKKIFETVAPDLHTNDSLQACYKNALFVVEGKGNIVAQSLKNVAVK